MYCKRNGVHLWNPRWVYNFCQIKIIIAGIKKVVFKIFWEKMIAFLLAMRFLTKSLQQLQQNFLELELELKLEQMQTLQGLPGICYQIWPKIWIIDTKSIFVLPKCFDYLLNCVFFSANRDNLVMVNVFFPENSILKYKRDELYAFEDIICKFWK